MEGSTVENDDKNTAYVGKFLTLLRRITFFSKTGAPSTEEAKLESPAARH